MARIIFMNRLPECVGGDAAGHRLRMLDATMLRSGCAAVKVDVLTIREAPVDDGGHGGAVMTHARRLVVSALLVVTVTLALTEFAAAAPEGQMIWAVHVTL